MAEWVSYRMEDKGSVPGMAGFFLFFTTFRQALRPNQPLVEWWIRRPKPEVDHSSASSAEAFTYVLMRKRLLT